MTKKDAQIRAFDPIEGGCDGSRECQATTHIHGCFVDYGNCNEPDEHGDGAPLHGSHY